MDRLPLFAELPLLKKTKLKKKNQVTACNVEQVTLPATSGK